MDMHNMGTFALPQRDVLARRLGAGKSHSPVCSISKNSHYQDVPSAVKPFPGASFPSQYRDHSDFCLWRLFWSIGSKNEKCKWDIESPKPDVTQGPADGCAGTVPRSGSCGQPAGPPLPHGPRHRGFPTTLSSAISHLLKSWICTAPFPNAHWCIHKQAEWGRTDISLPSPLCVLVSVSYPLGLHWIHRYPWHSEPPKIICSGDWSTQSCSKQGNARGTAVLQGTVLWGIPMDLHFKASLHPCLSKVPHPFTKKKSLYIYIYIIFLNIYINTSVWGGREKEKEEEEKRP